MASLRWPRLALRPALAAPPGLLRLVALLLLGAGLAASLPPADADGGWWGDLDKGLGVRLDDVVQAPERYRGRLLTFPCVFHQLEREFNPLRTRFHAERYDNISVWPDGAAIWEREAFAQDFPFLYIPRAHAQRDALVAQPMYTRLEVTARIEAVVDGYPFLELTGVRATGHRLGKPVMDLMLAGEVYGAQPGPDAQSVAAQKFAQALRVVPDLAPVYAARIRERLAVALRRLGRDEEAQRILEAEAAPQRATPTATPPRSATTDRPAAAGTAGAPSDARLPVPSIGSPDGDENTVPVAPAAVAPRAAPALPAPPRVLDAPLPVPGEGPPARRPRLEGVR